jgi:very-short-patch-repair endonuclease
VILIKYNINYESEKRFNDCRNKRPLPFDFYLPKYNICIEFDGEQHFIPWRKLSNKIEKLEKTKINDSIKTTYCINNNIKLLRIKYTEINNIEKIITSELKINNKI